MSLLKLGAHFDPYSCVTGNEFYSSPEGWTHRKLRKHLQIEKIFVINAAFRKMVQIEKTQQVHKSASKHNPTAFFSKCCMFCQIYFSSCAYVLSICCGHFLCCIELLANVFVTDLFLSLNNYSASCQFLVAPPAQVIQLKWRPLETERELEIINCSKREQAHNR